MYSRQEALLQDLEVSCHITRAKVTEAIRQLCNNSSQGVDEICPKFLKALNVSGLSFRLWSTGSALQLHIGVLHLHISAAQPVHMSLLDLEKTCEHFLHGILWEMLQEYGVKGLLLQALY